MSPIPNQGAEIGAPSPNLTSNTGSPDPNSGTEIGSPDPKLESLPVKREKTGTLGVLPTEKVTPHPAMVDSPSLKPVRIRNLIESFEKNIESKEVSNSQKNKKIDAFEALMMSGGKGDAPKMHQRSHKANIISKYKS